MGLNRIIQSDSEFLNLHAHRELFFSSLSLSVGSPVLVLRWTNEPMMQLQTHAMSEYSVTYTVEHAMYEHVL